MTVAPIIELTDVSKTFVGGTTAVQSLDLSVSEGEFVCVVGPSGCGKSTALRIIAGLSSITAGEIRRGKAVAVSDHGNPGIGFVFQEPTLLPWSSVWDNVYLPLRLKGQSRADARTQVAEVIELVGLSEFAHAYPRELSGGMKMRASIARALVTRPKLLLMDEPFGALDEMSRFALNDELLALWQQYRWTIAFVTHSIYEAAYLAQRVLVMSSRPGRIVADILVDAPHPRDEAFRRSRNYYEVCNEISSVMARSAGGKAK